MLKIVRVPSSLQEQRPAKKGSKSQQADARLPVQQEQKTMRKRRLRVSPCLRVLFVEASRTIRVLVVIVIFAILLFAAASVAASVQTAHQSFMCQNSKSAGLRMDERTAAGC